VKVRSRGLLAIALACAPAAAHARDDAQLWVTNAATARLGGNWLFSGESIVRFSGNRNGLYEIEVTSLLGYRLNRTVMVMAGYTHDPNYAPGVTMMERRAREQIVLDNIVRIAGGALSARLRLEQRWRDGLSGTGWRFRPFARFVLPLRQGGPALVLSHESFINLNTTRFQTTRAHDRMRNLVAIATPVARNATLEIGYLNQRGFVPGGADNTDHAASLSLNFAF